MPNLTISQVAATGGMAACMMTECLAPAPAPAPAPHHMLSHDPGTVDTAHQAVHALLRMVKSTSRTGANKWIHLSFELVLISSFLFTA